jgi:hypothetical protein
MQPAWMRWCGWSEDGAFPAPAWVLLAALLVSSQFGLGYSAKAEAVRAGFEKPAVVPDRPDTVVVRYRGPIAYPMAENLEEIGKELRTVYRTVVLDLDSEGGTLAHAALVIQVLRRLRAQMALHTVVQQGRSCLSACIPIFMQGSERKAGGASVWMFHGACGAYSNVPTATATNRYLQLLSEAGVAEAFLCRLRELGAFSEPGGYWMSGYELFHDRDAGVITELLPAWQPEQPVAPPFEPLLRPR